MKKLVFILLIAIIFGFTNMGNATLLDRGGGLMYDTASGVTWMEDANYARTQGYGSDGLMSWADATTYAANLSYYDPVLNTTLSNWRLPTEDEALAILSFLGYTITINLGAVNYTIVPNYDFITNVDGIYKAGFNYWTSSTEPDDSDTYVYTIWEDLYYTGLGAPYGALPNKSINNYQVWVVMNGDVNSVPEPATMLLLGLGVVGLAGVRRKIQK